MNKLSFKDLENLQNGDLIYFLDTDYKTLSIVIEMKEIGLGEKKFFKMKDLVIKEYDEPDQANLYRVLTTTLKEDEYWNSIDIYKAEIK